MTLLFSLLLLGCQSNKPIDVVVEMGEKAGTWIGFEGLQGTEIRVPDYYSTQQNPKEYRTGQTYYLRDLECQNKMNKCTN